MVEQAQVDPREAELVEDMTMDVMDYIHGRGSESIVKVMRESRNTAQSLATIVYKAVRGVAEKRKVTAQIEMDMDMMMGVTTAAIDMVSEVAEAAGEVLEGSNVTQLKEDVLLRTVVLHGEQLERTPEQREQAMTDLRDYMSDDGAQKALDYVNGRAKAEGLNPKDMERMGNEAYFGSQTPGTDILAGSIKQGLMGRPGLSPATQPEPSLAAPTGVPEEAPLMAAAAAAAAPAMSEAPMMAAPAEAPLMEPPASIPMRGVVQ